MAQSAKWQSWRILYRITKSYLHCTRLCQHYVQFQTRFRKVNPTRDGPGPCGICWTVFKSPHGLTHLETQNFPQSEAHIVNKLLVSTQSPSNLLALLHTLWPIMRVSYIFCKEFRINSRQNANICLSLAIIPGNFPPRPPHLLSTGTFISTEPTHL